MLADTWRTWLPFLAAVVCLVASSWVSPVVTWLLVVAAFGFMLDSLLSIFPRSGSLESHRQ